MAIFRKVHVSFWSDPEIEAMTPEQRYFFLYLLTNDKTTQCGIYEISKRKMANDTGYNIETVTKLLNLFQKKGKVKYSEKTGEIAIKNWPKYNDSTSPKVKACISKELNNVKDTVLIQYLYSMDTLSQEEEEQEEEKEKEQEKKNPPLLSEFIEYFNQNGYTTEGAEKAYRHYETRDWHDSKGNPVLNWKNKVANNWFKQEFKIKKREFVP